MLNLLLKILYEWSHIRLLVSRVNIDSTGMPDNQFSILNTSIKSAQILISSKVYRCSDFNRSGYGTEVAHVTRDSDITFRVKRSKVKVTRPLWLVVQVTT